MRAQWAALGADPHQARAAVEGAAPDPEPAIYELPPELWPAWECFVLTWNQWRVLLGWGGVHYDGIDHASLAGTMRMLGIKPKRQRETLFLVRVMEGEAKAWRNRPQ